MRNDEICKQKAERLGIASRCTFHEGFLNSLCQSTGFNAATCFLVSHFLTKADKRRALFTEIATRLLPNGILVNADISGDMAAPNFKSLLSVWLRMLRYAGLPAYEIEKMRGSLGVEVAVLPPKEVEELIKTSGFNGPTLISQSLLIHTWYSRLST
ncbi:hypothetical protein NBZ79_05560 [Sneathiella marina]|uniref:Methyltransferase type 11 domain-containing protein n=1 Tax=Sneathiella marina TaxID=2950108 RepID=A0ABY4W5H3_9PROT|nr:class I SAM-dependent methyltransferase [Sneathiella marina]USG62442.1 hypothetical protein NBZ79_05560 [Sneathiella marina]